MKHKVIIKHQNTYLYYHHQIMVHMNYIMEHQYYMNIKVI